jgi:hypothetical protein
VRTTNSDAGATAVEPPGRSAWILAAVLASAVSAVLVSAVLASPAWGATSVAVSPLNGTPDASPSTQISFLGVPIGEIAHVSVVGSVSGRHGGRLESYVSSPGASFVPARRFTQGERVTASAVVGPAGHGRPVSSTFTVARLAGYTELPFKPLTLTRRTGVVQHFSSETKLVPPLVTVTADSPAAAEGDIFLTPTHGYGQAGAMIVDGGGGLVWFHPVPSGAAAADLQVESYLGQPVLVWWQGRIARGLGVGFGEDEIYSDSYQRIDSIKAGNGYEADLHEAQLTPTGSAFITAYTLVSADLSSAGGTSQGVLQDAVVQQVDVPTGLVMFEWHAYGHVALTDSYSTASRTSHPWDFFHVNSVSLDPAGDGNFIVSARNMWAAYEINHVSGGIEWRLGGKHPSFKMGPGTGTAWQHDVRWQPDHTLTIFDNGASPKSHGESRAIRERIDFAKRTVTLIGRDTAGILTGSQGNDQVLSNGDSFVGWGESSIMTEFSPSGQVVFSADFPAPGQSYRTLRFPWSATPLARPAMKVAAQSATSATVYASWNGATEVASWQVLGGPSSSTLAPLATVPSSGFETSIPISGAAEFVAVQALGASGQVLGSSLAARR